jgi:hypothetical protein
VIFIEQNFGLHMESSRSCAAGWPVATSLACAAIF